MFCNKMKETLKNHPYIMYTIGFAIMACVIFIDFIVFKKSFLWRIDGVQQHYSILYNYNVIIRNWLHDVSKGLPMLSWNMGLGLDTIGQFSYYVIGDPFAYLSLLFPMDKLEIAYNGLVILRIYCIGIAFMWYCRYHNAKPMNTIVGALSYAFCGYVIYASVRHPYFSNPLIMLPIVLLGVDKLFKENKKTWFTVSIFVTAVMNYYFLYMISIIMAMYIVIKYCINNQGRYTKKEIIKKIAIAVGCYVVGVMIAAIILLPTIYTFLNSSRTSFDVVPRFTAGYYIKLITGLISVTPRNWAIPTVSSVIILLLPILYKQRKEHREIWQLWIVFTIMLLLPQVASAMNGFSYPLSRWSLAYAFLLCYIITITYRTDLSYTNREELVMSIGLSLYTLALLIIHKYVKIQCWVSLGFAIVMFLCILIQNKYQWKHKTLPFIVVGLVLLNICWIGYGQYSPKMGRYIKQFAKYGQVERIYNDHKKNVIDQVKQDDSTFYRIGTDATRVPNQSLVLGYHALDTYLSLGNGYVDTLSKGIANAGYSVNKPMKELDNRTKITTLLGTKYYVVRNGKEILVPYDYELTSKTQKTSVYRNKNDLSMGVFYPTYVEKEKFDSLQPLEKEQELLEAAVIEDTNTMQQYGIEQQQDNKLEEVKTKTKQKIDYTIEKNNILLDNHTIKVKNKKKDKIMIHPENVSNAEIYLEIKGLTKTNKNHGNDYKFDMIITYDSTIKKGILFRDKEHSNYYVDRSELLINMGGRKQHSGNIEIGFSEKGTYHFDEINTYAVPMAPYESAVKELKKYQLQEVQYGNNYLVGKLRNEKPGVLQITTSYSDGWRAYVDDKPVEVLKVNEAFIGIPVRAGEHSIRFEYKTPYLKQGAIVSVIGLLGLAMVIYMDIRKRSKQ